MVLFSIDTLLRTGFKYAQLNCYGQCSKESAQNFCIVNTGVKGNLLFRLPKVHSLYFPRHFAFIVFRKVHMYQTFVFFQVFFQTSIHACSAFGIASKHID